VRGNGPDAAGAVAMTPAIALTTDQAAAALGISVRQLKDRADIPRCDIAPPGATRAQWRYLPGDLHAFVAARRVSVTSG
jgi:hypothetical protein